MDSEGCLLGSGTGGLGFELGVAILGIDFCHYTCSFALKSLEYLGAGIMFRLIWVLFYVYLCIFSTPIYSYYLNIF